MSSHPESDLKALLDSTSDPVWSIDLEGRLTAFNRAMRNGFIAAYHREPEIGIKVDTLLLPENTGDWNGFYEKAIHEGAFQTEYMRSSGETMELSFGRIERDGILVGISIVARDVSERNRISEALTGFRNMFEDSGAVLLLVDPDDGIILDANRAAATYYGYPRAKLVGASIALVNTLPTVQVREEWEKAAREERNYFSFQHRLASGEIRDVRVYSSPVAVGGRKRLYSIVFDVTDQMRTQKQLQENAEVLDEAQKIGGIGNYSLDFASGLWTSSPALDEIFGIGPEFIHSVEGWLELIHPGDRAMMTGHFFKEVAERRQPFDKVYRIVRISDKAERWVHGLGKLDFDADGNPVNMRGVIKDITQNKLAEIALRSSEQRYLTMFNASLDSISVHRLRDGIVTDVNRAFLNLLGFDASEVIGQNYDRLGLWAEPGEYERARRMLEHTGSSRDTRALFRKKNGESIWVLISCSAMEIEGEQCVLSIFRDVSDAKAAEDKIWNLAFYDPLTKLPNRRLLIDRLKQMLSTGTRTARMRALLFIDLDNFKALNDTLGHHNGDSLLRETAQRLLGCVRASDTVARLGGDEFVVLLDRLDTRPDLAASQTEAIAHKILSTLEKPYTIEDRECFSTSSIGITVFGGKQENMNDLLQQADIAMYQAKSAGRNTMRFFEPALQVAVHKRVEMGDEMRAALKNGHFVLHLQPQMNMDKVVGAESLVRWQHGDRGQLLPGEFIPLAEETGLILPLGEWVLNTACEQIATWDHAHSARRFEVAVNISARQFHQQAFTRHILSVLERTGADPSLLNLEITESMLLHNIGESISKMQELKQHGVRFSLDDFGTGYSSLNYLKRLPFDQVKIDRSFVRDLHDDAGSRAIAQTVISLGAALGLEVLAEGVETVDQRELLMDLGCHRFQGYLFGRPLPLDDFKRTWMNEATPHS